MTTTHDSFPLPSLVTPPDKGLDPTVALASSADASPGVYARAWSLLDRTRHWVLRLSGRRGSWGATEFIERSWHASESADFHGDSRR
jgi:hypothetical protein